jgi:hypothetical protein
METAQANGTVYKSVRRLLWQPSTEETTEKGSD